MQTGSYTTSTRTTSTVMTPTASGQAFSMAGRYLKNMPVRAGHCIAAFMPGTIGSPLCSWIAFYL